MSDDSVGRQFQDLGVLLASQLPRQIVNHCCDGRSPVDVILAWAGPAPPRFQDPIVVRQDARPSLAAGNVSESWSDWMARRSEGIARDQIRPVVLVTLPCDDELARHTVDFLSVLAVYAPKAPAIVVLDEGILGGTDPPFRMSLAAGVRGVLVGQQGSRRWVAINKVYQEVASYWPRRNRW